MIAFGADEPVPVPGEEPYVQTEEERLALEASMRRGNLRMALILGVPFLLLGTGLVMIMGKKCT